MNKYKLHITIEFEFEDQEQAIKKATFLLDNGLFPKESVTVALNRDGDRSAKNLLAPVENSPGHYKNHKIFLGEVK